MAKQSCILVFLTILLVSTLSGFPVELEDTGAKITEACKVFFDPGISPTKDKILDSLFQMLDIASSITTASEYKDEIKSRIDVAKDLLKNESLFNEKARQYLSFAYRMMTNGRKFQRPEELDVFVTPAEAQEKAMKYSKELIANALSELEAGNPGETARMLLEFVLLVVTPISG
jgi:hypothetical protein